MHSYSISFGRGSPFAKKALCAAYDSLSGRAKSIDSAIATLCRRAGGGLRVITLREDGYSSDSTHYQATLGRLCPGGGFIPDVEIFVYFR
jgi:hypothetical protein